MSDRISEHISLKEAIKSHTATRLNIDNTPRELDLVNMKTIAEKWRKYNISTLYWLRS